MSDADNLIYIGRDSLSFETGAGKDIIYGADGNDTLLSNAGADSLYGGDGKDIIYNFDEDDILNSGTKFKKDA